jgi:beta-N-acetylhexosaminidase
MTLEQKVGQMFVIWSHAEFLNINSLEYKNLRDQMRKYHIGGFGLTVRYDDGFLYKNEPLEAAMVTNQLQKDSEFPLIFAADFERGLGMRLNEVTTFPHAMALGATKNLEYARQSGRITAQEARALGVQWNWFPDTDVNSNPFNPVINTRSFGEDPVEVGAMAAAYIEGAHEFGMLTTAKHFPGHGDTDTDSHLAVPQVSGDMARLQAVELPPFQAAIKAGVDAVLVGHVTVPALDPDPAKVATISQPIVTGLLKQKMGFKGLVVTDALVMNGLMKLYPEGGALAASRAAVEAVKAGNDVLLIPSDLDASYNGVLNAVRSGEIPQSRIDESVLKILQAKASVGLNKARYVDINAVTSIVARPENLVAAQNMADASVTLVRDNQQVLPLHATRRGTIKPITAYQGAEPKRGGTLLLIFLDDSRSDSGRVLDEQVRERIPGAKVIYVDARGAPGLAQPVMDAVRQADKVIAAVYEVPVAGRAVGEIPPGSGSVTLDNPQAALLRQVLQEAGGTTAVAAMGNPYIASDFPEIQTYLCTYSNTYVSEISAAKALFGEIRMTGRLPVTIPKIADRGTGIGNPVQRFGGGSE